MSQTPEGYPMALILIELCEGGSLIDLMAKYETTKLKEAQIIFILKQIAKYH